MLNTSDWVFVILTAMLVIGSGSLAFFFGYFLPDEILEEGEAGEGSGEGGGGGGEGGGEGRGNGGEADRQGEYAGNEVGGEQAHRRVYDYDGMLTDDQIVGNIADYSWLTSVNMYRYKDLPSSLEFFCTGTILTANSMLTGDSCIKEHFTVEDLKDAVIRSNSDYFWKDGTTHTVAKLFENPHLKVPYRYIFVMHVTPNFPASTKKIRLIAAPSVTRDKSEYGKLIVAGWGGEQDPTEQIRKNSRFIAHRWLPEDKVACSSNPCHKSPPDSKFCCNEAILTDIPLYEQGPVSGKVLVNIRSGAPQLLAIELVHLFKGRETTEEDLAYFIDVGDPDFIAWMEQTVPEFVIPANEPISISNTKHKFYSQMKTSKYIADMKYFAKYNPLKKYVPD